MGLVLRITAVLGIAVSIGVAVTTSAASATSADKTRADGGAIYRKQCAVCHGDHGDGESRASRGLNPPPRDFTDRSLWPELTRERMVTSVTYGRPDTAMVGWRGRLSEGEIAAVVDYVRRTFMADAKSLGAGERVYRQHCAVCHGDDGGGAQWTQAVLSPPPRDFTAAHLARALNEQRMLRSVREGRPGTAMMAFQNRLSPGEIAAVVGYIRAEFMRVASDAAAGASEDATPYLETRFPDGLVGDVERGREFYMENCYVCHGRRGDGRGPRARFIVPPPRNFLAPESQVLRDRPTLFQAIAQGKAGTVMPAWRQVLEPQEIANVAEFVLQAFLAPQGETAEKKTPPAESGG